MTNLYIKTRRVIYLISEFLNKILPHQKPEVIILCYHSISNDWKYGVSIADFKSQMNYLNENYQFISFSDLTHFLEGKILIEKPSVVVSFDDGYKDIASVKGFLKDLGINPIVFVTSDPNLLNREVLGTNKEILSHKEILDLYLNGWEIGCHSATHPDLTLLNDPMLKSEILDSKARLENDLGINIKYFSYPKGKYSNNIMHYVKNSGFIAGLSMDDEIIDSKTNIYKLPRIGVDSTHSFAEFKGLITQPAIIIRKFIKNSFLAKYCIC